MDFLVHDLLDLPVPASEFVADGCLRIDAILDTPGMRASLAFHAAWSTAVGISPTRADFAAFVGRVPGGAAAAAKWSAGTGAALVAEICTTSVRMLQEPIAKQVIERAAGIYERMLAHLSDQTRTLAALTAKLADRFGSTVAVVTDPACLPAAYVTMVTSDPSLTRLERWARGRSSGSLGAVDSVEDYYARARTAAAILNLPMRSPITGFDITGALIPEATPMSPIELLRYPITHDMYLWRQDVGGSLLISGSASHAIAEGPEPFTIRTVYGPCAALLLPAIPPAYIRVVVDVVDGDDAAAVDDARAHGRFVDVVSLAPAVDVDLDSAARSRQDRRLVVSRDWPRDSEMPARTYWLPTHDALFGAPEKPPRWTSATASSALLAHLQHPCPLSSPQPGGGNGVILMQSYVMRYASARRLGERVFVTAPPGKSGRIGEVVLIDNRRNVWSVLSMLVTLDNLRAADWSVRVLCGNANREWLAQVLLPHVPHACIETIPQLDRSSFDIENYNVLLKSPDLWRRLSASPRILTVQDDGMLALPGLDRPAYEDVMAQSFVGAPWKKGPDIYRTMMEAAGTPPEFVGNGGLSLRDPVAMLSICEAEADGLARALFNSNMQPLPEDVFFAIALGRRGAVCPREQATRFAFEMDLPEADAPLPLGFHKPWPYSAPDAVSAIFERLLSTRLA